jgi:hypothetical protein
MADLYPNGFADGVTSCRCLSSAEQVSPQRVAPITGRLLPHERETGRSERLSLALEVDLGPTIMMHSGVGTPRHKVRRSLPYYRKKSCLLYPQEQTRAAQLAMSATGPMRTSTCPKRSLG